MSSKTTSNPFDPVSLEDIMEKLNEMQEQIDALQSSMDNLEGLHVDRSKEHDAIDSLLSALEHEIGRLRSDVSGIEYAVDRI